jgi:hypothetical protein
VSDIQRLSVEDMRELCPSCADEMERRHLTALKVDFAEWQKLAESGESAKDSDIYLETGIEANIGDTTVELANTDSVNNMPRQLLRGLCNDIGDTDKGFFTRCTKYRFGAEWAARIAGNKKGFCAWLHRQCIGKWPGEKRTAASNEDLEVAQLADNGVAELQTVGIRAMAIVRSGSFRAKTGPIDVTPAMLASMVKAAKDPEIRDPVIKIGHVGLSAQGDGAPAMGWLRNIRMSGDRLLADAVGIPRKYAPLVLSEPDHPAPYRSRSVEIEFNVTTPGGRKYPAVLTALALLGEKKPAISNLDDVLNLYTAASAPSGESHVLLAIDEEETTQSPIDRVEGSQQGDQHGGEMAEEPEQQKIDEKPEAEAVDVHALLEMPADASPEDIAAKLDELKKAAAEAEALRNKAAASEQVAEGIVQLSKEKHEELVTWADQGRQAFEHQQVQIRGQILEDAIRAGKIHPNERAYFSGMLENPVTFESTKDHLDKLQPGFKVPTAELGSMSAKPVHLRAGESDDEFYKRMFPDEAEAKE